MTTSESENLSASSTTVQEVQLEMEKLYSLLTVKKGFPILSVARRKEILSQLRLKNQEINRLQNNSTSSKGLKPLVLLRSLPTLFKMYLMSLRIKIAKMLLKYRNKVPTILIHPDPKLKRIAKPVNFDTMSLFERTRIVRRMGAALGAVTYGERLGLAAPQIGINYRIIVVRGNVMFNPSWTPTKASPNIITEGCYSAPGRLFKVDRAQYGWAKWTDINGRPMEDKLNGLPAIVFQHEINHLDGICCVDIGEEIKESGQPFKRT